MIRYAIFAGRFEQWSRNFCTIDTQFLRVGRNSSGWVLWNWAQKLREVLESDLIEYVAPR